MITKLILTTLLLSWISAIEAYFYVPNFASTLPFIGGMSTAQRNMSLIMFGGETALSTFNNNNLYELTQTGNSFNWQAINQVNAPPGNIYGQAIVSNDQSTMYLLGGMTNTTNNREVPFQYYAFNFQTNSWTAAPTNANASSSSMPLNRKLFSATYDNANKIYIYGGALNDTAVFNNFFSFDITTNQFTPLASPNVNRFGHTASYLSNGKIVVIGGSAQITQNQTIQNTLVPMSTIHVYDIASNTWELKTATATGVMPSTRNVHNAVVTSDNKIIVFGGDNNEQIRNRAYLNSVAILDTNTWQWSIPNIQGIPPSRRSYASGGLIGKNLVVAFGSGYNTYYNDINVLNVDSMSWLQTFSPSTSNGSSGLSGGAIAGISIACIVVLVIILFLLWKFQKYARWLAQRIHRDIWKPRTGEPLWAETTRIVCQILLLFIFFIFLAFVVRQAINSPNVTQKIVHPASDVQVPDVRFCFDGFPLYPPTDIRTPGVSCSTDTGYSCTQFVQPLNMSLFQPTFSDNLGAVSCVLFAAPKTFTLASTSGSNNGSRLLFTMFGDQTVPQGRIHVSVYPKAMNPNTVVYGLTPNEPSLLSTENILNWQTGERNDIQVSNVYSIQPFTYSALSYQLIDHQYLKSDASWNYVGFLPITNSTPEVATNFRSEAPNPTYTSGHIDLGVFAVTPDAFVTTIEREVKMYTLVNALGFVGGIFGLLIALQAWLFGYRPRSPWGVVHRWSVGNLKRSLLRGLHSKFKITDSGVPLVHPVHHRFSVTDLNNLSYEDSEVQRINRVEERMQMLEMLFKAYYVDDEVFRSLDDANRVDTTPNAQKARGMPFNSNAHLNDSARFSPPPSFRNVVNTPKTEKVPENDYPSTAAKPDQPFVHPFTRQDTDASSASHIPLTHHQRPHAPPYQPSTTVQLSDED